MMIMSSCSTQETGHLTGVIERPNWSGFNPYGMVYVPSGNAHIGQSDQDMFSTYTQRPKSISVQGFFMDDTEITNNEYRQFVYWVRDSIAHTIMGDFTEDEYGNVSTCSFELNVEEILGVNDTQLGSLILYPNPADNYVSLSNPNNLELFDVTVYDLMGRMITKLDLTNMGTEKNLDISKLANATYMILIRGEQGTSYKQLIVNN